MDDTPQLPGTLPSSIEIEILEALFDPNPDMVFFIKNPDTPPVIPVQ